MRMLSIVHNYRNQYLTSHCVHLHEPKGVLSTSSIGFAAVTGKTSGGTPKIKPSTSSSKI